MIENGWVKKLEAQVSEIETLKAALTKERSETQRLRDKIDDALWVVRAPMHDNSHGPGDITEEMRCLLHNNTILNYEIDDARVTIHEHLEEIERLKGTIKNGSQKVPRT